MGLINTIMLVILGLVFPALTVIAIIFLSPAKAKKVMVIERREGVKLISFMIMFKRTDKSGVAKMILRKQLTDIRNMKDLKGTDMPLQDFTHINLTRKGKDVVILLKISEDEYVPCEIKDDGSIVPLDVDLKAWDAIKTQMDINRFQKIDFFQKYAVILTILAVCIGVGFLIYVSNMRMSIAISEFTSATNVLKDILPSIRSGASAVKVV